MNERVSATNKTSATPPQATQASSPLLHQSSFTEEQSESVGSNSNISKELGGIQPKTIRRSLNWQNISVEAPSRGNGMSLPGGIQRQQEEPAAVSGGVSADSAQKSALESSNSTISTSEPAQKPLIARAPLNRRNIPIDAPARSSASSTYPGGIQRLETSDVKEQEESTESLQMQPKEEIQAKSSSGEPQEKEEQNQELVQTKLTVGAPGDKYEQEADSMAAKVMTMPDEAIQQPIQRQTREETEAVQMQPLVNSITPLVQRESGKPPTTLEQLRSGLTDNARKAFDQQRELVPEHRFSQMETAYKNRDGTYDVDRANKFFEKKLISDAEYQEKIKQRNEGFLEKANDELARIENSCDETDGTNRPNSTLGDRTSESALRYESENGEPYKSAEGHYQKIATYIKTLQEAIQNLNNHRPFIRDPNKLSEIDAAINRAQERINKMQPALNEWNNRASNYPDKWNPNGISKVKPGWPSDPSPK